MPAEQLDRGAGCAAKAIDGLIRISNGEDVCFGSGQRCENLDLREVGVLKFVDENEGGAGSLRGEQLFVGRKQFVRPYDHVAERTQIFFPEPALGCGEDAGNFLTAGDYFG